MTKKVNRVTLLDLKNQPKKAIISTNNVSLVSDPPAGGERVQNLTTILESAPNRRFPRMTNIKYMFVVLFVETIIFIVLRIPSLFEPYWYGDEGIYQTIGIALRQGRQLYTGIWDNKPPLLYLLYAFANGDQLLMKFISLLIGLISVILFFIIAKKLFKKEASIIVSTFVFSLFIGLPIFDGNIANAENFILPLILMSFAILLNKNLQKPVYFFIAGISFSLAFLFKITALFDTLAFSLLGLCIYLDDQNMQKRISGLFLTFFSGYFLPIVITVIYFLIQGVFNEFIQAVLTSNVSYSLEKNIITTGFNLLLLKLIIFCFTIVLIFIKRKKLSTNLTFIFILFFCELFAVLFTQRPYIHYILLLLPSLSLLFGLLFEEAKIRYLTLLLITVTFTTIFLYFKFNTYTFQYYWNFIQYVAQQKSRDSYFAFFDDEVLRNYRIADYLQKNMKPNDKIFIWGNDAQIYKLINKIPVGRFTVAYHIINSGERIEETKNTLQTKKPGFIVLLLPTRSFLFSLNNYKKITIIEDAQIYEYKNN